jgi:transcriptional regulator NrdR family protein
VKCPRCRGDCNVADSREEDGGLVHWRRRRCAALLCGHEWETLEHETVEVTVYVPRSSVGIFGVKPPPPPTG